MNELGLELEKDAVLIVYNYKTIIIKKQKVFLILNMLRIRSSKNH